MSLPADSAEHHRPAASERALRAALVLFAVYHLGLAAFMTIAPHAFYRAIGPFEALNRHYIRDVATFSAALGVGFAVSVRRPSWRVPVLAVTTVQFALHTVNHLLDADRAHPEWTGWFDFVSLLAATLLLAWTWRAAASRGPAGREQPRPEQSPLTPASLPERSPS
jgi:hypothetical protein